MIVHDVDASNQFVEGKLGESFINYSLYVFLERILDQCYWQSLIREQDHCMVCWVSQDKHEEPLCRCHEGGRNGRRTMCLDGY